MSTNTKDTYLAVFLGSKTSPRTKAWMALPEAESARRNKRASPPGKHGRKSTTTPFLPWVGRSERQRRLPSALSRTSATRWVPSWSCARIA